MSVMDFTFPRCNSLLNRDYCSRKNEIHHTALLLLPFSFRGYSERFSCVYLTVTEAETFVLLRHSVYFGHVS